MADRHFTQDMDAEQIKRAKAAGKLAQKHIKGTTLYEAIEVGEVLLNGRAIAMRVSSSNAPSGRRYAEAFGAWKRQFGFDVKGQELPPQYLENSIAVAMHRPRRRIIAKIPAAGAPPWVFRASPPACERRSEGRRRTRINPRTKKTKMRRTKDNAARRSRPTSSSRC